MIPHSWSSAKLFTSKGIGKLNLNLRTRRKWNFKMIKLNIYHPATLPNMKMKDIDLPYQGEELSMLIPLPMAVNGMNHLDILHAMAINGINDLIEAILTSHKGRYCQTQSKNVEFFFQSLNWRVTLNWSSFKFSRHAVCYWQKYGRVLRNGQK